MDDLHPSFSEKAFAKESLIYHKLYLRLEAEENKQKRLLIATKLHEKRKLLNLMQKMITHDVINFDE